MKSLFGALVSLPMWAAAMNLSIAQQQGHTGRGILGSGGLGGGQPGDANPATLSRGEKILADTQIFRVVHCSGAWKPLRAGR